MTALLVLAACAMLGGLDQQHSDHVQNGQLPSRQHQPGRDHQHRQSQRSHDAQHPYA